MNDRRLREVWDSMSEDLDFLGLDLQAERYDVHGNAEKGGVLAAMRDAMHGWPKAQSYDRGGRRDTVWCDEHERELHRCHAERLDCAGAVITRPSDSTGDAAVLHDRASADRREHEADLLLIARAVRRMTDRSRRYRARSATEPERRNTSNDNDTGCDSCSRIEVVKGVRRWEPVFRNTVLSDSTPASLCSWCYGFTRDTGRLPDRNELEAHHRGERVKRPA